MPLHDSQRIIDSSNGPSPDFTELYSKPSDARALAAQVSTVATDVLNGGYSEAQLDVVRLYSNLVRSAAQIISAEVSRARHMREVPDLSLEEEGEE